jgi:hypothetical protein
MSTSIGRSQDLANRLEDLRHILTGKPEAAGYLKFFDDFLEEGEFGLALHAVCDYLLEPDVPAVDGPTMERIRYLHTSMEIRDECVDQLNAKIA